MSDKNSFGRRTWDREEYARLAAQRREQEKDKHNIKQVEGHKPIARDALNFAANLNKRQVITSNVVSTRGKSFGFYCEVCDLTFKDNLKFVDHLNSKPHLIRSGEVNQEVEVSLEQVKERFKLLVRKEEERRSDKEKYDIKKRIEKRRQYEEKLQQERKQKKIQLKEQKTTKKEEESDTTKMMGFGGFGSTKR